jgi:hypothetical protein
VNTEPVDPAVLVDLLDLLDDLADLVDLAAVGGDGIQRYHAEHVTTRLRDLRARLAGPAPPSASRLGDWYTELAFALGDTSTLPRAALGAHLDQFQAALDRAFARRQRRWWRR